MRERKSGNISAETANLAKGAELSDAEFTPFLASWAKRVASTFEEGLKAREKLEARILKTVGRALAKIGGRKALTGASALALIASACAPLVSPSEPTPASPEPSATSEINEDPDFTELEEMTRKYAGMEVEINSVVPGLLSLGNGENFTFAQAQWPGAIGGEKPVQILISIGEYGQILDVDGLAIDNVNPGRAGQDIFMSFDIVEPNKAVLTFRDIRRDNLSGNLWMWDGERRTWVELLGEENTIQEVRRGLGVEASLALKDLTPTPQPTEIPTSTPTPTEAPMYKGEFPDTSEYYRRMGALEQHFLEFEEVRTLEDMKLLNLMFGGPLSLVQVSSDSNTGITQFVWGFSVGGNDYRFRTFAMPYCEFRRVEDGFYSPGGGDLVGNPTIGQSRFPVFLAVQEPLSEAWQEFTGRFFPACSDVMGDLLPQDKDRLGQFFFNGNTEGFEIDERGILDLRRVLITTNVLVVDK